MECNNDFVRFWVETKLGSAWNTTGSEIYTKKRWASIVAKGCANNVKKSFFIIFVTAVNSKAWITITEWLCWVISIFVKLVWTLSSKWKARFLKTQFARKKSFPCLKCKFAFHFTVTENRFCTVKLMQPSNDWFGRVLVFLQNATP